MTKQSIKDFLTPQSKFFVLGFISFAIILLIISTTGVDIVEKIVENTIFLTFIFGKVSSGWINGLLFVVWLFAISYFFSCLFASFYQKIFKTSKNEEKRSLAKNIIWMIVLLLFCAFITMFPCCSSVGTAKNSRIISAIAQARTVMVYVYGNNNSYEVFSSTTPVGDMAPLSQEVLYNGGSLVVAKRVDNLAACIYSPLNPIKARGWVNWLKRQFFGTPKIWYCADSTGVAGQTKIDPGSTGYCVDGLSAKCPPIIN